MRLGKKSGKHTLSEKGNPSQNKLLYKFPNSNDPLGIRALNMPIIPSSSDNMVYNGMELTREDLIDQIIFQTDDFMILINNWPIILYS